MRRLLLGVMMLGTMAGCGGADMSEGSEPIDSTEQALARKYVLASDQDGKLWGSNTFLFSQLPLAPNTKAVAVEAGNIGQSGDYYVSEDRKLFERDTSTTWLQRFGGTFIDISSAGDVAYAVTQAGTLLKKTSGGDFEYVEELQVKVENGTIIPLSRIDICKDGTPYAVSADQRKLFTYHLDFQMWSSVNLFSFNGADLSYVQDVGCGAAGLYVIGGPSGRPPAVYRRNGSGWAHVAGSSLFIPSRLDVDFQGFVWFVAHDSFNGGRLWILASDGTLRRALKPASNGTVADLRDLVDVGG